MNITGSAHDDRLAYLHGRLNYERLGMPRVSTRFEMGRMSRLLRELGRPERALRIIHVAGTKGKGSTSVLIAAALSAAGIRTGLFTSPHLQRLEERFRVDDLEMSPDRLVELVDRVQPIVERLDRDDPRFAEREATFFEITTAIGLLHFAEAGASAAVLEVGLGGRLDSTNVVRPVVSVITSISFDHMKLLGNTLDAIAREKAGILKRGRPAVLGPLDDESRDAILEVARSRGCPVRRFGVDYVVEFSPPKQPLAEPSAGSFRTSTWRTEWGSLPVPFLGAHQARNAAVALAVIDLLDECGMSVPREAVARGFAGAQWPARLEIMSRDPWLVIDGAHNLASAEALADALGAHFPPVPRTLVFGTTRDKDLRGQLRALLPRFDRVVATRYLENPRAVPIEELARAVEEVGSELGLNLGPPRIADSPASALEIAREITPLQGLICVTGSLFLAGETRAALLGDSSRSAVGRGTIPAPIPREPQR